MSAAEKLQQELYSFINSMDEKSLRTIHAMIGAYVAQQDLDFWDELSDEDKAKIETSRQQYESGKGILHSEVMESFRNIYK